MTTSPPQPAPVYDFSGAATSLEAWRQQWAAVSRMEAERPWAFGDLFNSGRKFIPPEATEDEAHRQVAALIPKLGECGVTLRHLKVLGWVASTFPQRRRLPGLSWGHHREIWAAGVPAREHSRWLRRAASKGWSVRDLRVAMAPDGRADPMPAPPVRFVARRWADQGVIGLRELFPLGKAIRPELRDSVARELARLIEELRRVTLIA